MDGLGQSIFEEGLEQGIKQSREQGKLEIVLELVQEKILTVEEVARRLGMDQTELEARME